MTRLSYAPPLLLLVLLALAGCLVHLNRLEQAQLTCDGAAECPEGGFCIDGLCAARGSACVTSDGEPVADGSTCPEGRCVSGICRARGCGDGIVDIEDGELCDPLVNAHCNAECTPIVCGNGVLEAGEACDDGSLACPACVSQCDATGATVASNCDGDPANGCECNAREIDLPVVAGNRVYEAAVAEKFIYVTIAEGDANNQLRLVRVPRAGGGAAEELVPVIGFVRVVADVGGGVVVATVGEREDLFGSIRVYDVDGGLSVLATDDFGPLSVSSDADAIYVSAFQEGIKRFPRDGSPPTLVTSTCPESVDMVSCGDELLCTTASPDAAEPDLVAVARSSGDVRLLSHGRVGPSLVRFTCHRGAPVWIEEDNLLTSVDEEARLIVQLPATIPPIVGSVGRAVFSTTDGLAVSFNPFGSGIIDLPAVVRDDGAIVGLGNGAIMALDDNALFTWVDRQQRAFLIELAP